MCLRGMPFPVSSSSLVLVLVLGARRAIRKRGGKTPPPRAPALAPCLDRRQHLPRKARRTRDENEDEDDLRRPSVTCVLCATFNHAPNSRPT